MFMIVLLYFGFMLLLLRAWLYNKLYNPYVYYRTYYNVYQLNLQVNAKTFCEY